MNCEGATDPLICDYTICALETGMDSAIDACETAGLDYCDGYLDCYVDYVDCYLAACPKGTNTADANMTDITACTTTCSECAAGLATS